MVGDFTGVIKVIDLELGRLSQVSGWVQLNLMSPKKWKKKEQGWVGEMAAQEWFFTPLLVLRWRELCARTRENPPGAKGGPRWEPAGKLEPQSYNRKELHSPNSLNEQGNRFSHGASRKECSFTNNLFIFFWQIHGSNSNLQNCKKSECCLSHIVHSNLFWQQQAANRRSIYMA